jgi:hypothetical protein
VTAHWPAARARFDQLSGRARALGVRETLLIERDVLRRIVKSTAAATLAYLAAEAVGSPRAALASLAAIIVVQVTVRATLARSIQLTVAVTLGLAAATGLGHLLGLHWWSIGLVVLAGLMAGELFRLGPVSAHVAISAMLAMSLGSGYGIERVQDTVIGAAIGVVVNALVSPPSYVSEASRALRGIGEDIGALLGDMGAGFGRRPNRETIERWLRRARELGGDSRAAIATVKQGEESLQFNPLARGELTHLGRLTEARRALDHAISQTRGVTRTMLDLPQPIRDPDVEIALGELGGLLGECGRAVAAFGRLQERPESAEDRRVAEASLARARGRLPAVALALAAVPSAPQPSVPLPPPGPKPAPSAPSSVPPAAAAFEDGVVGRLLGSVYVDAERLLNEVDISSGAHRQAVAPEQS